MPQYDIDYSLEHEADDPFTDLKTATTYDSDMELYRKLGLKTFKQLPAWEYLFLGTVVFMDEKTMVRVRIGTMPAQYFKFTIIRTSGDSRFAGELSTDTGCLYNYWETVEKIVLGQMLVKAGQTIVADAEDHQIQIGDLRPIPV